MTSTTEQNKKYVQCLCGKQLLYYDLDDNIKHGGSGGITSLDNHITNEKCINLNSDAHIYTIKLERMYDNEIYYYVGETTRIITRLSQHISNGGDCALVYEYSSESYVDNTRSYLIRNTFEEKDDEEFVKYKVNEIINVRDLNKYGDESWDLFKYRCLNKERKQFIRVAKSKDTMNVLGGR